MKQDKETFITQQIKENLENLERPIKELSMFLPLPVYAVNLSGIIVDTNKAAKDLTGYNEELIIGKEIEFLFQDKQLIKKYFEQTLKNKSVQNREMILVAHNGQKVPVSISTSIRKDSKNNAIGCFLAIANVTEIKKFQKDLERKIEVRTQDLEKAKMALTNMLEDAYEARQRIEEEQNKTRAALTSLIDGLIVFDKEKRITLVNPEAERILNLKEELVINKKIDEISKFPDLIKLYKAIGGDIRWTGQIYELVIDGSFKRFFQIKTAPVVIGKEVVGMMVILHDVTRDKEIDKLKTEFVSIAAHQLRTPLSAIKWILRMVLDGDVGKISKEQADILEKAYQSNERMIILINDLLNVARVEEGRFIYNLKLQSMEKIIQKAIENSSAIAKDGKIELIFKKPSEPLPKVNVDKRKMDLAFQNLLDNAIRFNKPGGNVTISISCDKINMEVMIKDTGIGIPRSQQNRLFTKFFRADNAMELVTEGTGLGLFICKNIIEAHQGKIWFESEKNKGTTFWFTLPIKI